MYHEVYRPEERSQFEGLTNPAYNTEIGTFTKQMTWLSENKFKTLTIGELLAEDPMDEGRRAICLTFDDGWAGNYRNAFPVLKERGLRATFFVATDLIDRPLYMTWDQLREMNTAGMSIQSHTVTHRPLSSLNGEDQFWELDSSKRVIEKETCAEVTHLSLPHGDKPGKLWGAAREIGYRSVCTSEVGFHKGGSQGPFLKRISIGNGLPERAFRLIAGSQSRAIWKIAVLKLVKNTLKDTVGIKAYRNLYRWVYGIK